MAEILLDLNLDASTVAAAFLHDVLEDTRMTRQDLRREFGREVDALVNGVTKIATVKAQNKNVQETETIRKMLLAMVKDIRVILIKLADKLHNMRTLEYKNEKRRREIAQETLDIYAPLAGRLGISWLKDELEDLALKHLNHETYDQIKAFVRQKKRDRADYLQRVKNAIYKKATEAGLDIEVEARAKHFYSIYEKMKRRNKPLDEIYDSLGIRILAADETACYTMLGLVHRLDRDTSGCLLLARRRGILRELQAQMRDRHVSCRSSRSVRGAVRSRTLPKHRAGPRHRLRGAGRSSVPSALR